MYIYIYIYIYICAPLPKKVIIVQVVTYWIEVYLGLTGMIMYNWCYYLLLRCIKIV